MSKPPAEARTLPLFPPDAKPQRERAPRKPKVGIKWKRFQFDTLGRRYDGREFTIRAVKEGGFTFDGRTFPTLADAVTYAEALP